MVKLKKMATIVVSVELVVTPVMGVEFTDSHYD